MTLSSNALTDLIRQEIKNHGGAISFAQFMEKVLYHPEYGYYNKPHFTIGSEGDFTTAPEVSPLFAQCFAHQCLQILNALEGGDLLEFGAGTGHFAADLMAALEAAGSLPNHYYIYEVNAGLRKQQQAYLSLHCAHLYDRFSWVDALPDHFEGIMIANEVLDALPVHCFVVNDDDIKERCVGWDKDGFIWKLTKPSSEELHDAAAALLETYRLPNGYVSEVNLELKPFITEMAQHLKRGVILLADYGYGQLEYYHPERTQGTLTCFHQHRKHNNPLIFIGSQDITAHVDFTRAADIAVDNGCELAGFTTQAAFLLGCGLLDIAALIEKDLPPAEEFKLHQAMKVLTLPTEMGERIKIMGLAKNLDIPLMGFAVQDRRRDL